eukprot:PLAT2945.1.p1 GENE.PLAT2945.1~~PLAT2945.1.p1  ORF type:complete len:1378 (-),score=547.64 PLAT2945.1:102-4235(-)
MRKHNRPTVVPPLRLPRRPDGGMLRRIRKRDRRLRKSGAASARMWRDRGASPPLRSTGPLSARSSPISRTSRMATRPHTSASMMTPVPAESSGKEDPAPPAGGFSLDARSIVELAPIRVPERVATSVKKKLSKREDALTTTAVDGSQFGHLGFNFHRRQRWRLLDLSKEQAAVAMPFVTSAEAEALPVAPWDARAHAVGESRPASSDESHPSSRRSGSRRSGRTSGRSSPRAGVISALSGVSSLSGSPTPSGSSYPGSRAFLTELRDEDAAAAAAASGESKFKEDEDISLEVLTRMSNLPGVQAVFEEAGGSLELSAFVDVMLRSLGSPASGELMMTHKLVELFAQIDQNGSGRVAWEQFTMYMVEHSPVVEHSSTRADAIVPYKTAGVIYNTTHIDRTVHMPALDRLIMLERGNRSFKVCHPQTCTVLKEVHGHSAMVLDAVYLSGRDFVATSSRDLSIRFWNPFDFSMHKRIVTPDAQICLAWSPTYSTLYSAGTTGVLHAWDMQNLGCKESRHVHTEAVMDLQVIPAMDMVASASLDERICLWDLATHTLRKTLHGHSKGVLSLSYVADHRFLVSAGFDHDALVWNPYVDRLAYRLKGHKCPLLKVQAVPNSPEVITADQDGFFKVWDIRTFRCVQTFTNESDYDRNVGHRSIAHLNSFTYMPSRDIILASARKLFLFDRKERPAPMQTAQLPVQALFYNACSLTFLTSHGDNVKIWDAESGRLLRVYRTLVESEITATCLGERSRRFFIGDHDGGIQVRKYNNGSLLARLQPHRSEVSFVAHIGLTLISASWDGRLLLHRNASGNDWELQRELVQAAGLGSFILLDSSSRPRSSHTPFSRRGASAAAAAAAAEAAERVKAASARAARRVDTGNDIRAVHVSADLGLVATASRGNVVLWDMEYGKPDSFCSVGSADITALTFLSPLPVLALASAGKLSLWAVRPHKQRGRCLLRVPLNSPSVDSCSITWLQKSTTLVVGDDRGYISLWQLGAALNTLGFAVAMPDMPERDEQPPSLHLTTKALAADSMTDVASASIVTVAASASLTTHGDSHMAPLPEDSAAEPDGAAAGDSVGAAAAGVGHEEEGGDEHDGDDIDDDDSDGDDRAASSYASISPEAPSSRSSAHLALSSAFFKRGRTRASVLATRSRDSGGRGEAGADGAASGAAGGSSASLSRKQFRLRAPADRSTTAASGVWLLRRWKAHSDGVRSLSVPAKLSKPRVLSSSYDCCARVWDLDGTLLGCLEQGSSDRHYKPTVWKTPISVASQRRRNLFRAQRIMTQVMRERARAPRSHVLSEPVSPRTPTPKLAAVMKPQRPPVSPRLYSKPKMSVLEERMRRRALSPRLAMGLAPPRPPAAARRIRKAARRLEKALRDV